MLLSQAINKFYQEYFIIDGPIACIGQTNKEIVVYLKSKKTILKIPESYEGWPVIVKVSGRIKPL